MDTNNFNQALRRPPDASRRPRPASTWGRALTPGLALGLAAAALLQAPTAQAGLTTTHNVSLVAVRTTLQLTPQDVYKAFSLAAPLKNRASWDQGVTGPGLATFFNLGPVSPANAAITLPLRVNWNATPRFERCHPGTGACAELGAVRTGDKWQLQIDGATWEYKSLGNPCQGEGACTFNLPSWALEKRRQLKGGFEGLPQILTVVAHKEGVSLLDAQQDSVWLTVPLADAVGGPPLDPRQLAGAGFDSRGQIHLDFGASRVVLDLVSDRVYLVANGSLYAAESGITAPPTWRRANLTLESDTGALLLASSSHLVWGRYTVKWSPSAGSLDDVVGAVSANPAVFAGARTIPSGAGEAPAAFSYVDGNLTAWAVNLAGGWVASWTRPVTGPAAADLRLNMTGDILSTADRNLHLAMGPVPTQTDLQQTLNATVEFPDGDHIFVTETGGSSCSIRHLNAKGGSTFVPSGLSAVCRSAATFVHADATSVAISTIDGDVVKVGLFRP